MDNKAKEQIPVTTLRNIFPTQLNIEAKGKQFMYMLVVLCVSNLFFSCEKEPIDIYECVDHQNLSFNDEIYPILNLNCMNGSCHGKFDDYEYVKRFVDNDALLGSIQHKEGYSPMPKNDAMLADSLIVMISCWVQDGAPEF